MTHHLTMRDNAMNQVKIIKCAQDNTVIKVSHQENYPDDLCPCGVWVHWGNTGTSYDGLVSTLVWDCEGHEYLINKEV